MVRCGVYGLQNSMLPCHIVAFQCIRSTHMPHTFHARFSVFGVVWCGLMCMADKCLCYHVIWLPLVRQEHTHTHTFHTFAEGEKKQYLFGYSSSELKISI